MSHKLLTCFGKRTQNSFLTSFLTHVGDLFLPVELYRGLDLFHYIKKDTENVFVDLRLNPTDGERHYRSMKN